MSATPYLTDEEIADICEPLTRPHAQCRYLKDRLKLNVQQKPSGKPLVARSEFERVLGAIRFDQQDIASLDAPNVVAMQEHLSKRKNGTKSKGR